MKPFAKGSNAQSWMLFEMVLDSFITDKVGNLDTKLGDWTLDHSACRRWNVYKSKNDLVYKHVYNPLEEEERWRIYQHSRGELTYKETTTTTINYQKMTTIQINTCANGEKQGHITARMLVDAKK